MNWRKAAVLEVIFLVDTMFIFFYLLNKLTQQRSASAVLDNIEEGEVF
jgi:hypothetical protein